LGWTASATLGRRPLLLIGFAALPIRALLFALSADPLFLVGLQLLDGISGAVVGVLTVLSLPTLRMARVGSIWLKASLGPRQDLVLRSALHFLGSSPRTLIGRQHF
jgi:hypothetical protein